MVIFIVNTADGTIHGNFKFNEYTPYGGFGYGICRNVMSNGMLFSSSNKIFIGGISNYDGNPNLVSLTPSASSFSSTWMMSSSITSLIISTVGAVIFGRSESYIYFA